MIRVGVRGVGVGYCTFALLVGFNSGPEAEAGTESAGLSVSQTVLRIARSTDGRHFEDTGKVFARHAAAPDLLKLPDGGLLALFDYAGDGDGAVRMVVSASPNKGKRWTAPNPITITDEKGRTFSGRRGAWFRGPGGSLRLVFSSPLSPRARSGAASKNGSVGVWCATTRDGLNYRVAARADVIARGRGEVHPMAAVIDGRVHLYLASAPAGDSGTSGRSGAVRHFASDDGASFERLGATRMPGVGNLVALEDEHKAFVSGKKGIISLRANDQHHWRAEPGIRLEGGWDPAVVRLDDGSYLMLYCTRLEDDADSAAQLVAPNMFASHSAQDWQVRFSASELSDVGPDGGGAGQERSAGAGAASNNGPGGADRTSQESTSGAKGASLASSTHADQPKVIPDAPPADWEDAFGFVQEPDFRTPVDYFAWYRDLAVAKPKDNAYDAYAWFMPTPWAPAPAGAPWPEFRNMFSNRATRGDPAPWAPDDHPEWESSNREARHVLAQFRDAARYQNYAMPPVIRDDELEGPTPEEPLLFSLLLPQLGLHRDLVKAALADAWRTEDGHVSSKRMIDAMETTLRGAGHMDQGLTLIEDLVATAERALVQENARWALQRGVFSGDQLVRALDTLQRLDRNDDDPVRYLRGEHAAMMDVTQYVFGPLHADSGPRVNRARLESVANTSGSVDGQGGRLSALRDDDARATVEAVTAHYRELAEQMRIGYPEYRRADISAVTARYLHATPLTEEFLPNLSRMHQLRARAEASRRATQLAMAVHIFEEERGHFPQSLDELPEEYDQQMRIDPFTGEPFGYRVDESGPTIYTAGENGIDDGGIHSRRWDDDPVDGSDDYIFWPPQPR